MELLHKAEIINHLNLTPAQIADIGAAEVWMNDTYTVFVRRSCMTLPPEENDNKPITLTWLSIKRNDKEPCRDWRDFQWIKNQLVGEECEGAELFPAESRMVDMSNQYHLWVFDDPETQFGFGFHEGRQISEIPMDNGKQRPWPKNRVPADLKEQEALSQKRLKNYLNK